MKADVPKLQFPSREDFRTWLRENAQSSEGVWLVFGKTKAVITLSSAEALEEALCFGWIDGVMQSIDDTKYLKYFKQRADNSNWSQKNQKLAEKLGNAGRMTELGRAKIVYAKSHGTWGASKKPEPLADALLAQFCEMVRPFAAAYENLMQMSLSVRRTYASSYFFGAKTEAGKQKRFDTIIERLNLNLDPMQSLKKALEKQSE